MLSYLNVMTGEKRPGCRLCGDIMCFVETHDGHRWYHCHDCDMRNCDEEAG